MIKQDRMVKYLVCIGLVTIFLGGTSTRHIDVINPCVDESPRIITDKIAQVLQTIFSPDSQNQWGLIKNKNTYQ